MNRGRPNQVGEAAALAVAMLAGGISPITPAHAWSSDDGAIPGALSDCLKTHSLDIGGGGEREFGKTA